MKKSIGRDKSMTEVNDTNPSPVHYDPKFEVSKQKIIHDIKFTGKNDSQNLKKYIVKKLLYSSNLSDEYKMSQINKIVKANKS